MNMTLDAANRQSYWLLRNGQRLYRMSTAFHVGKTLVPKRDEFLSMFFEERYNHDDGRDASACRWRSGRAPIWRQRSTLRRGIATSCEWRCSCRA